MVNKSTNSILFSSNINPNVLNESLYVYILRCPLTQEIGYVGVSTHPKQRITSHCSITHQKKQKSRLSKWLLNILTQKQKPSMIIIEVLPNDPRVWELRENFWIRFYRLCGFELMNTKPGGHKPPQYNEYGYELYNNRKQQTLRKRLNPMSDSTKQKISVANTGKKRSPEQRKKFSKSHIGKKKPFLEKAVCQMDSYGNILATYRSSRQASESTGILRTAIANCIFGRSKSAGGFKWSHIE